MSPPPARLDENWSDWLDDLRELLKFDRNRIATAVPSWPNEDQRAGCVYWLYGRMGVNVNSLVSLDHPIHFQASVMLARSLFELVVDLKLLNAGIIENAVEKIVAFNRIELLRAAEKIVRFTEKFPEASLKSEIQKKLIQESKAEWSKQKGQYWPGRSRVNHWSGYDLTERVEKVGLPFEEWHARYYAEFSWYTHAGIMGLPGTSTDLWKVRQAQAFHLALACYNEALRIFVQEFRLPALRGEFPDVWL